MDPAVTIVMMIPVILAVALIINVVRKNITEREPGASVDITGAIPAVIVLLVAVMIIGSMGSSIEDREFELYDCEPLSSFGSEVTIEGDCAEIVTIGDTEYVRMTDLGTFTVTSGDSSKEYTVTKAKMDLVVFSGQSNSMTLTQPALYSGDATISPGQGFYFGTIESDPSVKAITTEDNVDSAIVCDMIDDDGEMRVAQMYPSFYGDYISETKHRLLTVSTGISGLSITGWDENGRGDILMETALERLKSQCEGKIDLNPVAVLWVQGEQDWTQTKAFYLEHFTPLLEKLESGYYSGYDFPYITASLPRTVMRPIDNMINPALAQIEAAEDDSHFTIATELAYRVTSEQMYDSVHFKQEYYGWVGEAFARQLAKLTGFKPVLETIVLAEDVGLVNELPSSVEAYGTTGKAYGLSVAWTESSGTYAGALSGNPSGTRIASGLVAEATIADFEYNEASKTLTINESIPTTSSYSWDGYAVDVTSLIISDGVSSVGDGAFQSLTDLEYMYFPTTLVTVGTDAFGVALKDYTGTELVSPTAGEYAGYGGSLYLCDSSIYTYTNGGATISGLNSGVSGTAAYIVLPRENSGTTITATGVGAFVQNTVLKGVYSLPNSSITTMAQNTFYGCTNLVHATLPDSVTTWGVGTFNGCTSLERASVPSSATIIPETTFRGCSALESIDMPSTVTEIGDKAFNGCTHIASFDIPGAVTSIGTEAFYQATGATSVSFGSGFAATLGTNCFASWTFYDTDGTTVIDKTVSSNLAGFTFTGTASALVKQA